MKGYDVFSCQTEGLSTHAPVSHMIAQLITKNSTQHTKQVKNTVQQIIGLQSETTTGSGHNKGETTYKPGQNTGHKLNYGPGVTTYKPRENQGETWNKLGQVQSETTEKQKEDDDTFVVFEEQEERQLRLETGCQNLNSSILLRLVYYSCY